MKLRLRVPRPSNEETDYFEQEEWKKKLVSQVAQVQNSHPDADVEVWTMDEHRVGLKPIIRRMWVDEWTVPIANVKSAGGSFHRRASRLNASAHNDYP